MATNKDLKEDAQTKSSSEFLHCGYQVNGMDKAQDKWKCIFCSWIIKEPIQLTECGHRGCRGCFESRMGQAPTGKISCPGEDCDYELDRSQTMVDRAFKKELDVLPITCIHKDDQPSCSWQGMLNAYQEHLDTMHTHFICESCKELFSSTQALKIHIESSCPSLFQKCSLAPYCTEEMIRREDFAAHLLTEKHQEATALILIGKYNTPESPPQDQDMERKTVQNELEDQTSEKLSILADKVQTLNDQTVKLSHDYIRFNELYQVANQEVDHFQTVCVERNTTMATFQLKQHTVQKEVEDLKQSLEENQHVSTDGSLTWRVDRVTERMADAQSERQPNTIEKEN
ncbi:hypothetical protein I4U23_030565 [Adineta vaga]|nr:hypothetical protein I4U23_030565 [Adineta vaga]